MSSNRAYLATLLSALGAASLAASCGDETACRCNYNCEGDWRLCYETDGGFFCYWPGTEGEADSGLAASDAQDGWSASDGPESGPDGSTRELKGSDGSGEDLPPGEDLTVEGDDLPDAASGKDSVVWTGAWEMRGIWVTRWDFNDAQDIEDIFDAVAEYGFNAVFFQVRGTADAFYKSSIEPWAKDLTGVLGKDPGWDPLGVAVEAGHARGLEVHAWMNTFTAWSGTTPPPSSTPPHILYAHPEWRQAGADGNPMDWNNSYTWVSPGIPEVREHVISVASEIASNYDVDGVHLDYVRYAGPGYSHDESSEAAYAKAKEETPSLSWGDFQRETLSSFVSELYASVVSATPDVKVTAAVWGIYKDIFGWGGTSQGYFDYFQDSHEWLARESVDAICPMVYWPLTSPKGGWTDFATLADDHLAAASGRHVYVGLKADYPDFGEIAAEVAYLREKGAPGYLVFAWSTLSNKGYGELMAEQVNAEPALPPHMGWK